MEDDYRKSASERTEELESKVETLENRIAVLEEHCKAFYIRFADMLHE